MKELRVAIIVIIVCLIGGFFAPHFASFENFTNDANLIGIYGIFGIGIGIVIISGGIDLSIGSVFAILGILFCMMINPQSGRPWPWPLAVLAILGMASLIGLFHAFFIVGVKLQPFIVTLCTLLIFRSLASYITDEQSKGLGGNIPSTLKMLTHHNYGPVPVTFIILLVIAAIMWVVLHRTVYGRYLFAVGRNEEAARFSGINTRLVIGSAYVVCMLLAGISAILLVMNVPSVVPSSHGVFYESYGIAAAVVGGCSLRGGEGSILGILLGTILIRVLPNLVVMLDVPSSLEFSVIGGVILAGVTLDQLLTTRKRSVKMPQLAEKVSAGSGRVSL